MSNIFDDEDFRDIPDEVIEGQSAPIPQIRTATPAAPQSFSQVLNQTIQQNVDQAYEEAKEEYAQDSEDEEDFSTVLSDARLRLEQGRLYEMIMNHNLFEGADADEKAIRHVQKQIRNFAKEQMEIMLGMRQEAAKVQPMAASDFPFNDAEVQALKDLAYVATKGQTAKPEEQVFSGSPAAVVPRKTGLNTIAVKPTSRPAPIAPKPPQTKPLAKKAVAPVKRDAKTEAQIEQILREEGITREEYERQYNPNYKPLTKPINNMNEQEIKEWKRQDALKTHKQVKNPAAIPMPTAEQEEMLHTQRAQAAASHPQMQSLMSLLTQPKK